MKFPKIKGVTIAVIYCFTFYALCGCSSTKQTTTYLDKYDSLPYKDFRTVNVSEDVAYKSAIVSLEKRGYTLTFSDPQTGNAILELSTSTKLPEEEKKAQADGIWPTVGTILIYTLAIVLVVGIVILIISATSDDSKDKDKDKDKNKDNSTQYKTGRIDSGHPSDQGSHKINVPSHTEQRHDEEHREHERHNDTRFWDLFVSPFLVSAPPPSLPGPSYRYVVSLRTTPLDDSTTNIQILTTRVDMAGGEITKTERFENKYLNYSIFDEIDTELTGR